MTQRFVVMEQPRGKGRPRFSQSGHAYTPETTREYEHRIAYEARKDGIRAYNGPVIVEMEFCMAIPKSWSAARRDAAKRGEIEPTTKPDIDNCIKAILDATNGIGWIDDKQVIGVVATKRYTDNGKTIVTITEKENGGNEKC